MAWRGLRLMGGFALCVLAPGALTAAPAPGKFGLALNANEGAAFVPANPAYAAAPLTFECWAKLDNKGNYNILVAHEEKRSATHWELFTLPGSGSLSAYLPGRKPDHAHTNTDVADGEWHYLALVMEPEHVRIFVDAVEKATVPTTPAPTSGVPGALAFGSLVTGELICSGAVDEVRLSRCARAITATPDAEFAADADTIGLWHFGEKDPGPFRDASSHAKAAELRKHPAMALFTQQGEIPGGMPTALQPLPAPPDTAPLRQAMRDLAGRLKLRSVHPDAIRGAVFAEWLRDLQFYGGKDYPESRGSWEVPEDVRAQVYDRHALIWETDGGPAGTVLRRARALLSAIGSPSLGSGGGAGGQGGGWGVGRLQLSKAGSPSLGAGRGAGGQGGGRGVGPAAADLALLEAAYRAEKPAPGTEAHRDFYLAACALRREIALANPLLSFDSVLCVARGTFAGSVRSNPANQDFQGGHLATQYFGFNALPGGGLYVVRDLHTQPRVVDLLRDAVVRNGRLKGKKLDHGAFATPDLSFDGERIVFAWTANREHRWVYSRETCWHLFRVNVDGTDLVQLTDGSYSDFDPCWLPNGRIAFISERRGGYIRCFAAYLKVRNYALFSVKDDGSGLAPLSYYETSEWNPTVANDGQILFTRWDYTDRENCLGTRLWVCGPDGTNPRAPHGNYPLPLHTFADHTPWRKWPDGREKDSRFGTPLVEMGIRAIPGSPLYLCTAAPHHGEVFGSLCLLDLGREDDGHMSQVKRITPDEPFPETEMASRRHYKYGTPWPLSPDFYLCNVWEGLCLVDRFGNKELLADTRLLPCAQDERLRLLDPIPLRPRLMPAARPETAAKDTGIAAKDAKRPAKDARRGAKGSNLVGSTGGASSQVLLNSRPSRPALRPLRPTVPLSRPAGSGATVAVMNVYDSDLPFPKGTKIKWLRVTQDILKENHAMGEPMVGYERENTPRIPLGIVPVEKDGSAYFEAPVAKELIFQVLDENYMAVHSMRSVAFVHPGERLTCRGCHESPRKAPAPYRAPAALRRAPSKLEPECGPIEPISYYRQIRPIFEGKCVTCHTQRGKGPADMSYEAMRDYTFWFSGAMFGDMTTAYSGIHGGSRTIPGRFGARYSRMGQALLDATHRDAVSAEDRHRIILWLDSNSLRLGAYTREAEQLQGALVWPTLDVDPENLLGVEGAGRPLRGSFWHENGYGPYAFLGASHKRASVYLMDEKGSLVWEYPAPNPQDVWMLPNGNVLTTWLHGVKEVTRDKQVVWEYRVDAPNEVPTCQPLADGSVLIGIVGECRLIEVNRKGEVLREVKLSTTEKAPHAQFRMCRRTPEGTYLVPFTAEGAVREYRADGSVLRSFPSAPTPVCAVRLENGNTLISAGGTVTEYDRSDRVVWQLAPHELADIRVGVLAGVQRLPNGNTVVCNWGALDEGEKVGAHVFEVTPDKRIVWQVAGNTLGQVAQCQLLNPDLTPRRDGIAR